MYWKKLEFASRYERNCVFAYIQESIRLVQKQVIRKQTQRRLKRLDLPNSIGRKLAEGEILAGPTILLADHHA